MEEEDNIPEIFGGSSLYEEEVNDGWAIAEEEPENLKFADHSGKQWTFLPPDLFANFALTQLNLANNSLTWLPEDIAQLGALEELYLQHNNLVRSGTTLHFPLPNLTVLRLAYNGLEYFPQRIGMLTKLRVLDLSYNKLTVLPSSVQYLTSLESLRLEHNHLTTLIPEIYHLSSLKELHVFNNRINTLKDIVFPPRLEVLELGNNQLTFVSAFQFSYIESLLHLGLSNNRICFVDEEVFLENLHSLTQLHLASNDLQALPFSIGALKNLQMLTISQNQLTELPNSIGHLTSLITLYLNSNNLYAIPRSIGNLKSLELLDLSCMNSQNDMDGITRVLILLFFFFFL